MRLRGWGILVLLVPLLSGCGAAEPVYSTRFPAFGTLVDFNIVGVERARAERVSNLIAQELAYMHDAWHAWKPGPLGRVNRLITQKNAFAAPPSVLPLISKSQELAAQSENLFNPAIGQLVGLWGFHADSTKCHRPPERARIERLVAAAPRMSDLELDGLLVRSRNPAVQLDFGAIAKGYGIDLAMEHLRELGIRNALLDAGGDLRAMGDRSGQPWRVAVRHPDGGVLGVIMVSGDESLFTSSNSDRNFIYGGVSYHHVIDPRTGYPAEGIRSVTVAHTDATTADAAATALFVAGLADWHRIAQRMGIRYVLLVDSVGTLHMNPAMAERFEVVHQDVRIELSPPLTDPTQRVPIHDG